jgi:hypothetical protein
MNFEQQNAQRTGSWMQTVSGRPFWPLSPRPEDFDICDIAHALSMLCRFGGHPKFFYSVAEHSVLVSHVLPPELALCGLMHDATEAYCVDVPRPLKRELPQYQAIESGLWMAIAERFNLPDPMPPEVHAADNAVLLAEKKVLLRESPGPWDVPGVAADVEIHGYPPEVAKDLFLSRFAQLLGQDMQRRRQKP